MTTYILTVITTFLVICVYFFLKFKTILYLPDAIIVSYLLILNFYVIKKLKQKEDELNTKLKALNTTTEELKATNEELQALNLQLLKSKKEYENLSNYHQNILINMNHELKTPLNSIIGFSTLLKNDLNTLDKKDIAESINLIEESAKRLNLILNNIISLSKSTDIDMETEEKCESCKYLIDSIISTTKGLLKDNNKVVFTYQIPQKLPKVHFDEKVINMIMLNIIIASIYCTEKGIIELKTIETDQELEIQITDTGRPVNIDKIKDLFSSSSTQINTNEPEYKLFLAKQLAIKHNIDFFIENTQTGNKYILKLRKCEENGKNS